MRAIRCGFLLFIVVFVSLIASAQTSNINASNDLPQSRVTRRVLAPEFRMPIVGPTFPIRPGPSPRPPVSLSGLSNISGMIFSGTVVSIARTPVSQQERVASVAITFHVDRAIRGTIPGEQLTVREWAGLWMGDPRYHVGERLLIFFYPPSKLGLTSPVGGALGTFAINNSGRILLSPEHRRAFRADLPVTQQSSISFNDLSRVLRRAAGEE